MKIVICVLFSYIFGSLNPAALISKLKRENLRKVGTGNLGATNTALVFGRTLGFVVMIFDVFKGFLSVKIAAWIAPEVEWLFMLAGFSAVIGHCFPFYLKFKGGKGLAAFGGVVLAYDPHFFLFVLISGVIIVLLSNSGTALTYYAAFAFPIYVAQTTPDVSMLIVCIVMSVFMMIVFIPNLIKAIKGQEYKSRDYLKGIIQK